jgi:hypothetical protein
MAIIATYIYKIYKGDTDVRFIEFFEDEAKTTPFDLNTYAAYNMQVKKKATQEGIFLSLSLGSGLAISDTNKMTFTISDTQADIQAGNYVFDLEGSNVGTDTETILAGDFIVEQDVTRL